MLDTRYFRKKNKIKITRKLTDGHLQFNVAQSRSYHFSDMVNFYIPAKLIKYIICAY